KTLRPPHEIRSDRRSTQQPRLNRQDPMPAEFVAGPSHENRSKTGGRRNLTESHPEAMRSSQGSRIVPRTKVRRIRTARPADRTKSNRQNGREAEGRRRQAETSGL